MFLTITSPSLSDRLLSLAGYFGAAPLTRFWRSRSSDPFLQHHFAQAMAAFFVLLLWFFVSLFVDLAKFCILIRFPDLDRRLDPWELDLTCALLLVLGALVVLWIALLGLALGGSSRQIPLLKQLTRRSWVICLSSIANSFALALIPAIAVLACHATSLTRTSREDAAVYFLYDDGIPVPRWGYALGLYRVSLQAQRNWGKGCTVLDRLNQETLRTALAHGKVVFLATHGEDGYVYAFNKPLPSPDPGTLCVGPPAVGATDEMKSSRYLFTCVLGADNNLSKAENFTVSSRLCLAYIFACSAGKQAS